MICMDVPDDRKEYVSCIFYLGGRGRHSISILKKLWKSGSIMMRSFSTSSLAFISTAELNIPWLLVDFLALVLVAMFLVLRAAARSSQTC